MAASRSRKGVSRNVPRKPMRNRPAAAAPGERLISSSLGGAGSEPVRCDPAPISDASSGPPLAPPPVSLKREPASTVGSSSPPRRKIT